MLLLSIGLIATATMDVSASSTTLETGKEYFVSQNKGRGRVGSMEQPAKDLAAIAAFLEPGDRVHIAQGTYMSKTGRGTDIIEVPVSIIGGYSDDFQSRDPWGKYRTILSGTNDYNKSETTERLAILTNKKYREWEGTVTVDGIIVDNGSRNRYANGEGKLLLRKASPVAQEAATPGNPGIKVRVGAKTNVVVTNCVVLNCASSQGAIDVQIGRDGKGLIENNLIVNNTGEGIYCKTLHHGATGMPQFTVRNNTVLFSWIYDGIASSGGSSIMMDAYCSVHAENNVFGFGDMGGVNNVKQCKALTLTGNLLFGHTLFDYREFRSDMPLDEMEDYAEKLDPKSMGNVSELVELPLNQEWAGLYFNRQQMSRAEVDAAATVSNSEENQLRSILGLPLQGSTVKMDVDVWLHRMQVEDAIRLGMKNYKGKGCVNPNGVIEGS
ncbi:MAG: hypothetical protein AAF806_23410 [Bacteroidota bacterium]